MAKNTVKIVTEMETCETCMEWEMDRFVLVHLLVKYQPICSGNFYAAQQKSTFNLKLIQSKQTMMVGRDRPNKFDGGPGTLVAALVLQLVTCPKDVVSHKFFYQLDFGGCPEKSFLSKSCQDFVVQGCSRPLLEIPWSQFEGKMTEILWQEKLVINLKLIICLGEPKSTNSLGIMARVKAENEEKVLLTSLEKLFQNRPYSDIIIECGNSKIPAHKCILTARSTVFAKMFQTKMKESVKNCVKIKDIDGATMKLALEFMYTGKIKSLATLHSSILMDLVGTGEKYDLTGLKAMCLEKLFESISDQNCPHLAMTAYLYNVEESVKAKILHYCQSRHSTLIQENAEYKKLFHKTPQAFLVV